MYLHNHSHYQLLHVHLYIYIYGFDHLQLGFSAHCVFLSEAIQMGKLFQTDLFVSKKMFLGRK